MFSSNLGFPSINTGSVPLERLHHTERTLHFGSIFLVQIIGRHKYHQYQSSVRQSQRDSEKNGMCFFFYMYCTASDCSIIFLVLRFPYNVDYLFTDFYISMISNIMLLNKIEISRSIYIIFTLKQRFTLQKKKSGR